MAVNSFTLNHSSFIYIGVELKICYLLSYLSVDLLHFFVLLIRIKRKQKVIFQYWLKLQKTRKSETSYQSILKYENIPVC